MNFDLSNLQESNHELEDGSQPGSEDRNEEDSVDAATNGVITWESVTRNMASTTVMSPQTGSFVIRKHDGKTSSTPFVRTDPEDKTKLFEVDVSDLSSLNCKDPSWFCWDTFETKKTNTDKQLADCLTESLKAEKFAKTQQMMCGWHCLTQSLTLCETSLLFIATSFKRECCWNVPRCPISFRLECAQFGAHSFSFHVQDSGTQTGSLSPFSDNLVKSD